MYVYLNFGTRHLKAKVHKHVLELGKFLVEKIIRKTPIVHSSIFLNILHPLQNLLISKFLSRSAFRHLFKST